MEEKEEPLYVIKPRFSFLYEMFMPTGRKIKNSILMLFATIVLYAVVLAFQDSLSLSNMKIINQMNLMTILNIIFGIMIIALLIRTISHLLFQMLQYKYLSYTFYQDHMVYEDTFLNQHRKTIEYSNIKEVEIRRTIMDRVFGYGIIIIYTNAENTNNGLVVYSIQNPQECYDKIQEILRQSKLGKKEVKSEQTVMEKIPSISNDIEDEDILDDKEAKKLSEIVNLSEEEQENFEESLKNIND